MEQRLSLITLGVDDLDRSAAFFERLGWQPAARQVAGARFYRLGCLALSLYPWRKLAEDAGLPHGPAAQRRHRAQDFNGVTLAHNTRARAEVDAVLAAAAAAGAEILKPAADAFWGGYSGYFRDLDGHVWEVAWNPHFPLDAAGAPQLPD